MTKHIETAGVAYPTPVARVLADLAGYLGDDWAAFATDLTREADAERGKYGEDARDWFYAEITGTHVNPDEWSKPEPPAGFMLDLTGGLDLNERQKMRLAMAYTFGDRYAGLCATDGAPETRGAPAPATTGGTDA